MTEPIGREINITAKNINWSLFVRDISSLIYTPSSRALKVRIGDKLLTTSNVQNYNEVKAVIIKEMLYFTIDNADMEAILNIRRLRSAEVVGNEIIIYYNDGYSNSFSGNAQELLETLSTDIRSYYYRSPIKPLFSPSYIVNNVMFFLREVVTLLHDTSNNTLIITYRRGNRSVIPDITVDQFEQIFNMIKNDELYISLAKINAQTLIVINVSHVSSVYRRKKTINVLFRDMTQSIDLTFNYLQDAKYAYNVLSGQIQQASRSPFYMLR
jgi:hypothetical protein